MLTIRGGMAYHNITIIKTVFTIPTLTSHDTFYTGPTGPTDQNDLCKCNTVVYSLMSACAACQGSNWFSCVCPPPFFPLFFAALSSTILFCKQKKRWNTWKKNCTSVDASQTFVLNSLFPPCVPRFALPLTAGGMGHIFTGFRTLSRMGRACRSGHSLT